MCTGLTAVQQVQPPTEGAPVGPAGATLVTAGQALTQSVDLQRSVLPAAVAQVLECQLLSSGGRLMRNRRLRKQ